MNGNTPFLRTCMSGQSKAAKFWLQNGAKITDVDKNSHSALHVIVRNDPSLRSLIKTAEVLLAEGADATMKTRQGLSPFHLAVRKPNLAFIKLLYDFCPNLRILRKIMLLNSFSKKSIKSP